jgi:pyochelin synthetase
MARVPNRPPPSTARKAGEAIEAEEVVESIETISTVETIETIETIETVETIETIETVETIETIEAIEAVGISPKFESAGKQRCRHSTPHWPNRARHPRDGRRRGRSGRR